MTVAKLPRINEYVGAAGPMSFPIKFQFLTQADISVALRDGQGNETIAGAGSFTVSGGDGGKGAVTFTAGTAGFTVVIRGRTEISQKTEYPFGTNFPSFNHERTVDRAAMIDQEQQDQIEETQARAFMVPAGAVARDIVPAPRTVVYFDEENQLATIPLGKFPKGPSGGANSTYDTPATVTDEADVANQSAIVADPSRGGTFAYREGDYSALIAADTRRGVFIPAKDDLAGKKGAWLRIGVTELDPRWFRLKGDVDDTAAIQAALNFAQARGGGPVALAPGTYNISAAIRVPGDVTFTGYGPFSCIIANGCNAIILESSDSIGPRRFAGIWLRGNGAEKFAAITVASTFPERVQGLVIENNYISFFGTAIWSSGLWHSTIRTNTIHQVYRAIVLSGRNVKIEIYDNRITRGSLISGVGRSIAIQVGDETVGLRPEDVQVHHNICFNFDVGLYWRQCLYGAAKHNDFDYCNIFGIHFVTADGGTVFHHNWIQVDNDRADICGIYGEALGIVPGVGYVEISANRINATTVRIVPGEIHSYGIKIDPNQANVHIIGGVIEGAFEMDIKLDRVQRVSVRRVQCEGQFVMFNCVDVDVDANYFGGGITLSGNTRVNFGTNFGLHTTKIRGTVNFPENAKSVTTTYLALNMPDLPLGGYQICVTGLDRGNLQHLGLSYEPTRSGITFYSKEALAPASAITFTLEIY